VVRVEEVSAVGHADNYIAHITARGPRGGHGIEVPRERRGTDVMNGGE
jgi:hypothetical protein